MKPHYIVLILFFVAGISSTFAQGVFNNGSKIIIPSGNYININSGNYTNNTVSSTDGSITLNGEIDIEGHWTNNADNTLTLSNGTVTFDGTSTQNITGTEYTEFYNLTIASGADVEVPADHFLTVDNNLTMTGDLTLKSTFSGGETVNASLMDAGNNTGNLNVELYLTGGDKNHLISSPVNNAALTSIFDASNGNYNIFWYDETQTSKTIDNRWIKQTTSLVNARGYTAAYDDPTTRTFEGTLATSSDITIDITKSGSSGDDGWNLIGNPYPSAISCTSFVSDNSSISGTLYFWDEDGTYATDDYASWNSVGSTSSAGNKPGDYIPVGQAFFVEKSATGTSSISFKNSQRSHQTSSDYYFFTPPPKNFPRIKLSLSNDANHYNEILIGFPEDATNDVDRLYDGKKLEGDTNISFYTLQFNQKYSIQGYKPLNGKSLSIPLGYKSMHNGKHYIKTNFIDNFTTGESIYLQDLLTNSMIEIKDSINYQFEASKGEEKNRFVLHFNYTNAINQVLNEDDLNVFLQGDKIIVQTNKAVQGEIIVSDLSGKTIFKALPDEFLIKEIPNNFSQGYYIITVLTNQNIISKKLFIK